MKVSVIVPVYNVENYLEKCVNSIINQTERDIQIILVDDGSTDKSPQICDELSLKDDRIVVFHKKNGGLSSARNKGLENAKADYVCFIDSDDIIAPYYVEHLLSLIEKYDCDVAVGKFETFTDKDPSFDNIDNDVEIVEGKNAINKLFGKSYVTATIACNKVYKKSLFDDIKFPEGKINEDEATAYRIFYKTERVAFSNSVVYGYYMRDNSITKSKFSKRNFDFLEIAWERCMFFKERGEERYYYVFLKIYCWTLLEFAKKTKKILRDKKTSKALKKEFKKKSKLLVKLPYMSKTKKLAVRVIRICPLIYYVIRNAKSIKKGKKK